MLKMLTDPNLTGVRWLNAEMFVNQSLYDRLKLFLNFSTIYNMFDDISYAGL